MITPPLSVAATASNTFDYQLGWTTRWTNYLFLSITRPLVSPIHLHVCETSELTAAPEHL